MFKENFELCNFQNVLPKLIEQIEIIYSPIETENSGLYIIRYEQYMFLYNTINTSNGLAQPQTEYLQPEAREYSILIISIWRQYAVR